MDCYKAGKHLPGGKPLSEKSIKEVMYRQDANKFGVIRCHTRNVVKDITKCQACGYDKHVEVCHVKSIGEFDLDTLLSVVNDRSNLMVLCPNCHWEFDHGLLKTERPPESLQGP